MDFPEEVMVEILSWLPVKSLMRFKCVSKPWLQLLSTNPRFIKLHFNRSIHPNNSNPNPGIIIFQPTEEYLFFHYAEDITECGKAIVFKPPLSNPDGRRSYFQFVNVCNGLLCLPECFVEYIKSRLYVWNPITGDYITIPYPPIPSRFFQNDGSLEFGVDFLFGFGYNQISDEFKVVFSVSTCPFDWAKEHESHVSVYTLGTGGSWRTLQGIPRYGLSRTYNSSTPFINGALHCLACKLDPSQLQFLHQTLLAFNMQDEIFEEIQQPHGISYDYPFDNFVGELGGLLSISRNDVTDGYVEIWVMEEYSVADSWTKLWKIVQPDDSPYYMTPLGFASSGELVISKSPWEWISYDPNTDSIKDLHMFEFEMVGSQSFKGSLLLPTIINRAGRTSHMNH